MILDEINCNKLKLKKVTRLYIMPSRQRRFYDAVVSPVNSFKNREYTLRFNDLEVPIDDRLIKLIDGLHSISEVYGVNSYFAYNLYKYDDDVKFDKIAKDKLAKYAESYRDDLELGASCYKKWLKGYTLAHEIYGNDSRGMTSYYNGAEDKFNRITSYVSKVMSPNFTLLCSYPYNGYFYRVFYKKTKTEFLYKILKSSEDNPNVILDETVNSGGVGSIKSFPGFEEMIETPDYEYNSPIMLSRDLEVPDLSKDGIKDYLEDDRETLEYRYDWGKRR